MPPKRRHDGLPEGIYARHRKSCPNAGQPEWSCGCPASYQAQAWSKRDGRRPTRTFPRLREAVKWRNDARSAVQSGKLAVSRALTLRRASDDFMEAAETKLVLNRSGRPYKPSALRSYRTALDLRILPDYGAHPVIELRRSDWQRLVTTLHKQGLAPSTIRNTFDPYARSTAGCCRSTRSTSTRPAGSSSRSPRRRATASPHRPRARCCSRRSATRRRPSTRPRCTPACGAASSRPSRTPTST